MNELEVIDSIITTYIHFDFTNFTLNYFYIIDYLKLIFTLLLNSDKYHTEQGALKLNSS